MSGVNESAMSFMHVTRLLHASFGCSSCLLSSCCDGCEDMSRLMKSPTLSPRYLFNSIVASESVRLSSPTVRCGMSTLAASECSTWAVAISSICPSCTDASGLYSAFPGTLSTVSIYSLSSLYISSTSHPTV